MPRPTHTLPSSIALSLVVDALATYRLTRLVTRDVISEPLRRDVVGRSLGVRPDDLAAEGQTAEDAVASSDDPPRAATLITCRWCTGVWVAGGVVLARLVAPRYWEPVARGLSLSAAAALLAGLEDS